MTRREFRLISGQGAGPSVEDITRRKPTRRHFKTLQVGGGGETTTTIRTVTIKGIDKTDGTTIWEYGPGSMWRHHYGADAITGLVPDTGATLDKYVLGATNGNNYVNADNRSAATLVANAAEPLTITKLDSLDGSVIESATLTGMFASYVSGVLYQLTQGITITETCALSGGNYVIVGRRVPFVEFVDFTSNTTSKSYILHAHTQQGANVYIKTRTSSEVITIPYNSTAAEVETLFEATADCTAATVSGGPWPHLPIEIDVTWSASGGDIAAIKTDATFSGTGPGSGTCEWQFDVIGGVWNLTDDNCTTGTPQAPTYTPAFPTIDFGTCEITGVSRSSEGVAATYDPATGEIQNSIGKIFGRAGGETLSRLIASTTTIPTVTGVADNGIYHIVAGPSDCVLIVPSVITSGKAAAVECHTVDSSWTTLWKKYLNTGALYGIHCESDTFCVSFAAVAFTGGGTAGAALIDAVSGTVTEYNPPWGSLATAFQQNQSLTMMLMDDPTTKCGSDYELTVTDAEYPNIRFKNSVDGSEVWHDGTEMLLGATPVFGADSGAVYGLYYAPVAIANYNPGQRTPSGSIYKTYQWVFHVPVGSRFGSTTGWRFRFASSYTSWLSWTASAATIQAAVLTIFPENTSGIVSNCVVHPFGAPSSIVNTDASWLEQGLVIHFNAAADSAGIVYGFPQYNFPSGQVAIEFRNVADYATPGIAAWDATDASVVWSRAWGTVGATTITHPQRAWLRGDFVYAYGNVVDAE